MHNGALLSVQSTMEKVLSDIFIGRTKASRKQAFLYLCQQYRSIYRWFTRTIKREQRHSNACITSHVMHRPFHGRTCWRHVKHLSWDVKKRDCVWCVDIFWPAWSIAVYRATRLHVIRLWRNKNARIGRTKLAWDVRGVVVALVNILSSSPCRSSVKNALARNKSRDISESAMR